MKISVVVAVKNEIHHIENCLTALCNQNYKDPYEIIIVDGLSTDGTYELLQKLKNNLSFTLLQNEQRNAAAGRNLGILNATGDYVAFIDGDAIASTDWLTQIQKAIEKSGAAGVGGPDLLPNDTNKLSHIIGVVMTSPLARGGRLNPSTQHALIEEERYVEHIPTCNVCFNKDILKKIGMFDETFVKGQDLELNYRLIRFGYKLFYTPKIKVTHYRKQSIPDFSWQIYKWAKAKIAIIKKHGIINHAYLLPIYALITLLLVFALSIVFNLITYFFILLFLGGISYILSILFESARLAITHKKRNILPYGLLLFPIIHISYTLGVITASIKRKIW